MNDENCSHPIHQPCVHRFHRHVLNIKIISFWDVNVKHANVKAHTDRTRFGNATRIFSFQKQIKPSMDKNFTRYADQIAKIA
jgi:hypothetical protein